VLSRHRCNLLLIVIDLVDLVRLSLVLVMHCTDAAALVVV
jgi:hypothetical protein